VGKENILGLVSVRQIQHDSVGEIFVQEKSSHIAGACIVPSDYPLYEIDISKRYDNGLNEAIFEAKKHDESRGITFIEDWKKPAVKSGTKIRL
jgi:hypothetical protein